MASPYLLDGSCAPAAGTPATTFEFRVTYRHPQGMAPGAAWLVLIRPDAPAGTDPRTFVGMAGAGTSYAAGVVFTASRTLTPGAWRYQFEFTVAGVNEFSDGYAGPVVAGALSGQMGPLRRDAAVRDYFVRPDGTPVFLAGSHTWDTIQDFRCSELTPRFDFPAFVRWLQALGHNFTRLWRWEYGWWQNDFLGAPQAVDPHPWPRPQTDGPRAADGLWKFDLSQLDMAYLDRLDDRVAQLEAAGIYCSVMLFEGCVSSQFPGDPWRYHPFCPTNNVQGIGSTAAAFYSLDDPAVLAVQQAYVRAVVERLNGHKNLLWEVSNETMASSYAWQCQWVTFIRSIEAALSQQHPVGMTAMVRGGTDEQLKASPADWISPAMANYQTPTFPNTTGKVVLLDTDHLWGMGGNAAWVAQAAASGYNVLFMDPYVGNVVPPTWNGGDPATWQAARQQMGSEVAARNGSGPPPPPPDPDIFRFTLTRADGLLALHGPDGAVIWRE